MKVLELYDHVSRLGFESSLEDTKLFYNTVNRAVMQVNALRPAVRTCEIDHRPLKNLIAADTFDPVPIGSLPILCAASPRSFCFEAKGNGHYFVEAVGDGDPIILSEGTIDSPKRFMPVRGVLKDGGNFVTGTVQMRFTGEFVCLVRNVALYKEVYSDNAEDVPAYSPYCLYNIADIVDDFLTFCDPPIKTGGEYVRMLSGYEVEGESTILLPISASGTYEVHYNHKPMHIQTKVSPTTDDTVIDLAEDLCALLPVLIAAYAWLEDEPDKSAYYMNLYREMAVGIERNKRTIAPAKVRDVYGWT